MKKIILTAAMLGTLTLGAVTASANNGALAAMQAGFTSTSADCFQCHLAGTSTGAGTMNVFGKAWKDAGGGADTGPASAALTTLGTDDVDNDTINNKDEAIAGTLGDGLAAPATTTTTTSDSGGGCITSSATTPLMMVLAMLALGFFVRRKKA